jgi:hypothetical protein
MAYSFNKKARELGEEVCTITITAEFVKHVHEMQLALRRHVSQKDIAIETNPTSNKLISTFKRYDKHPIFNFYNRHLDMETNPQLYVSINTDDQGVFSTTLENEYYLLSRALECAKNPDGTEKYSHQQIRDWLDDIREMGLSQSFQRPSAGTGQDAPRG